MGLIRLAALVLLALFFSPGAKANIVVGLGGSVTSLDPHFHNNSSNGNIAEHIFDALVARGDDTRIMPALATSWKLRGDSQWEFKLRPGVTFHDGSPFTADDVLFSLARTKTIKHSPSPYTIYTKAIQRVVAVDKLTVHIFTDGPAPQLLNDLAAVSIVSKRAAEHATTDDFNAGKALVGTGPFKFAAVWRNERIDLIRHDRYWGRKPLTARATILLLQNDAARTAALLAGRADVIGSVPPQDVKIIAANPAFSISKRPSFRLMYLHLDSTRKQTPFATAMDGAALATNPLRDQRVRRAISKAINRQAIVSKGLEGMGEPSGQLVPVGAFSHVPELRPENPDVADARRLLAAAGYPHGFRLTIHATNDHYVNDKQIAQTIASMLTKVGIATKVESMPSALFFARANKLEFSLMLAGWNADSGMAESAMKALLASHDAGHGMGNSNRGRYSNPAFDTALTGALATFDEPRRRQLLQTATRIAMADLAIVPLYFQTNVWATKKEWQITPRQDGRTYIHHMQRRAP